MHLAPPLLTRRPDSRLTCSSCVSSNFRGVTGFSHIQLAPGVGADAPSFLLLR